MSEPLYRDPNDFDETQKAVMNDGFREGKNCVVMGCAGSGKSCIAMAIFVDLCGREGRKPVIVTKQRSLVNTYLDELLTLVGDKSRNYIEDAHSIRTHHGTGPSHVRWFSYNRAVNTYERGIKKGWSDKKNVGGDEENKDKKYSVYHDATDLIVDEAQDFTQVEMNDILKHFSSLKSVHFFGDDNQQIYEGAFGQLSQLSMTQLVQYASRIGSGGVYAETLENNYRLPNPVACFVDAVEGPESMLSEQCLGKGTAIPRLLRFDSEEKEFATVCGLIRLHKNNAGGSKYRAAVICYTCSKCDSAFEAMSGLHCDDTDIIIAQVRGALDKGKSDYRDRSGPKTIDGDDIGRVNEIITTAFSSKGLQYDDVFVLVDDFVRRGDDSQASWPRNVLNVLHVAMTRTQGGLFVLYRGEIAFQPFAGVPERLYMIDL